MQKTIFTQLFIAVIVLSSISTLSACGGSGSSDETITPAESETPPTANDGDNDNSAPVLVVNEIVASAINDGNDWIELYANSDIADLSIYTIVDDNNTRVGQTLPSVPLSSGSFIVIQAIDEQDTPPESAYYVTFKLGSDDAVYIYEGETLISELDWQDGQAEEGYSYGLFADGTGDAVTLAPTEGEANEVTHDTIIVLDKITNNDASVRINEIVAKADDGGYDWIEFYGSGNSAVHLGDYSVSDENSEMVALPNVTIAPGEFYRVYATEDEIENAQTVAFKLGSADEVNLYKSDDLIDSLSWDTGEALIGYSYGRFPDGSDAKATQIPSPQTRNVLAVAGPLVINEVVASQNDDTSDWFELYNNSDSDILLSDYQVIDASDDIEPTTLPEVSIEAGEYFVIFANGEESGTNAVNFKLGKEDELSLIKDDETVDFLEWQDSDVSAGYSFGRKVDGSWMTTTLAMTQGASNQVVNIYDQEKVESIHFEIEETQWQDLLENALEEEYHLASITYKGVTLEEVAIRTKGNSSLNSVYRDGGERYSFNIDINEYVSGQRLLGMKKFVLNNSFNDPSYMREYIAYELFEEMGVTTPERSYVNVYVNDELIGLYLMVEHVNEDYIDKHFANTEGDMYKPDGIGSDLQYIDDSFTSYAGVELKTNEDTSDNGAFVDFIREMEFGDALSVIDTDSVLRYLAVSAALSNLDSYQGSLSHNYYIYEQDNVFSLLPWDLNEAFGTFNNGCNGYDIRELYIDEPTSGLLSERPLIAKVLSSNANLATYHGYLQNLIDGPLSNEEFIAKIARVDALISEHVENDPTAFYSYSQFKTNQNSNVARFYGLTSFVNFRVENIKAQLNGSIPSSGNGRGFCSG